MRRFRATVDPFLPISIVTSALHPPHVSCFPVCVSGLVPLARCCVCVWLCFCFVCWKINGTVAYAAQRAWIQNATLRDNVLFGSPMDPERYARVLSACALTSDLDLLEAGDQTEIGEKGYAWLVALFCLFCS